MRQPVHFQLFIISTIVTIGLSQTHLTHGTQQPSAVDISPLRTDTKVSGCRQMKAHLILILAVGLSSDPVSIANWNIHRPGLPNPRIGAAQKTLTLTTCPVSGIGIAQESRNGTRTCQLRCKHMTIQHGKYTVRHNYRTPYSFNWRNLVNIRFICKCVPQISIFGDFWAVSPRLLSQNGKIWREGANLGGPPPCQIL